MARRKDATSMNRWLRNQTERVKKGRMNGEQTDREIWIRLKKASSSLWGMK